MNSRGKKRRKLTVKQKKFAKHYAATGNGAQSAKAAGYSKNSAPEIASENLTKPNVRKAIHEALEESLAKAQLKSDHVIEQLRRIAFSDIAEAYDENGKLLHPHQMPEELRAAVGSIETDELRDGKSGFKYRETKKIKMLDRTKAAELLGRHFKLFTDVVETKNTHTIAATDEQVDEATKKFKDKL